MATNPTSKRQIIIRLIHDGLQPGKPVDELLQFGVQDAKGEVHSATREVDGTQQFDVMLEVVGGDGAGQPVFRGAFVHGPPAARFLYLSWKRQGEHQHPWAWRVKVPLSGIGWSDVRAAETPMKCLVADVIGRRPHASDTVKWQIAPLHKS